MNFGIILKNDEESRKKVFEIKDNFDLPIFGIKRQRLRVLGNDRFLFLLFNRESSINFIYLILLIGLFLSAVLISYFAFGLFIGLFLVVLYFDSPYFLYCVMWLSFRKNNLKHKLYLLESDKCLRVLIYGARFHNGVASASKVK